MVMVIIILMLVMGMVRIVLRMVIMTDGKSKWPRSALSLVIQKVKSVEKVQI